MFHCVCVCGRLFVHGRMSLDGNKPQKVFQDAVSKACCVIMMMSVVLIDTKHIVVVTDPHWDGWGSQCRYCTTVAPGRNGPVSQQCHTVYLTSIKHFDQHLRDVGLCISVFEQHPFFVLNTLL